MEEKKKNKSLLSVPEPSALPATKDETFLHGTLVLSLRPSAPIKSSCGKINVRSISAHQ
jgi:hypothetical protein